MRKRAGGNHKAMAARELNTCLAEGVSEKSDNNVGAEKEAERGGQKGRRETSGALGSCNYGLFRKIHNKGKGRRE